MNVNRQKETQLPGVKFNVHQARILYTRMQDTNAKCLKSGYLQTITSDRSLMNPELNTRMPTQKPTIPQTQSTADEQVGGTADSFVLTQTAQVHCHIASVTPTPLVVLGQHPLRRTQTCRIICRKNVDKAMMRRCNASFCWDACLKATLALLYKVVGRLGEKNYRHAMSSTASARKHPKTCWVRGQGLSFIGRWGEQRLMKNMNERSLFSSFDKLNAVIWKIVKVPIANRAISVLIVARLTTTAVILSINAGKPAYTSGR